MPKSVNATLLDEAIYHQIELTKYSNSVVRRMVAILNRIDADLFMSLASALEHMTPETYTIERLQSIMGSIRAMNAAAYGEIAQELPKELQDFTGFEVQYQKMALEAVMPIQFSVAAVSVEQVYAAAMAQPFNGEMLAGTLDHLGAVRARRIQQHIAIGYTEGKTATQIVRELKGTKMAGFADGLVEMDRRNLQAVVQSALAHTAAHARDHVYDANSEVLKGVMWSATLDQKTTSECRIRDGKMYTLDHEPMGHKIPWKSGPGKIHWCCRSCSVPQVKGFAELLGLDGIDDTLPASTRASMDGQVADDTTYNDWLKRQSAARQDEVLGPVRGKLLRDGNLAPEKMYTNTGEYMTLDQLRAKYSGAFRRAGV